MSPHISSDVFLELFDEVGPFGPRAHETHIPSEHVPELRQFINVVLSERCSNLRAALIVLRCPHGAGLTLSVNGHGPEFEKHEHLALLAASLLAVEHRAGRVALDQYCRHRNDRRGDKQAHHCTNHVFCSLEQPVPVDIKRPWAKAKQWHVGYGLHVHIAGEDAEYIGHQLEGNEVAVTHEHDVDDLVVI